MNPREREEEKCAVMPAEVRVNMVPFIYTMTPALNRDVESFGVRAGDPDRSCRGGGIAPGAHVLLPRLLPEHVLDGPHGAVEAGIAEGRGDGKTRERVRWVGQVDIGDKLAGAAAAAFVDGMAGERAEGVVVARVGEGVGGFVPGRDMGVGKCGC